MSAGECSISEVQTLFGVEEDCQGRRWSVGEEGYERDLDAWLQALILDHKTTE